MNISPDKSKTVYTQEDVVAHIMQTNPPLQIQLGLKTPDVWAEMYLSPEPDGYALLAVAPSMLHYLSGIDARKVHLYTIKIPETCPPIVLDRNLKMQAPRSSDKGLFASTPLVSKDRVGHVGEILPHIVIDGKHRVAAFNILGELSIPAFVPVSLRDQIIKASHNVEVAQFATAYFQKKEYEVVGQDGNGWGVLRNGRSRTYTRRDIRLIAKNTGHQWRWGED